MRLCLVSHLSYHPGTGSFYGSGDLDANGEITYIIPRPSESHSVLLGGTYQAGNWDTSIDLGTAARILERCSKLEPSLADPASSARVVSHQVGLRPARVGGPRVEREQVSLPTQSKLLGPQHHRAVAEDGAARMRVVHAYGFGWAFFRGTIAL
jgi:D-amino-acid oxidase